MKRNLRTRVYVSIAMGLLGMLWAIYGRLVYSWSENKVPGPGFFPVIVGVLLIAMSIPGFLADRSSEPKSYYPDFLYPILAVVLIVLSSYLAGLVLSVFLMLFIWLKSCEKMPLLTSSILSVSASTFIYGVFGLWLRVPFPRGLILNRLLAL